MLISPIIIFIILLCNHICSIYIYFLLTNVHVFSLHLNLTKSHFSYLLVALKSYGNIISIKFTLLFSHHSLDAYIFWKLCCVVSGKGSGFLEWPMYCRTGMLLIRFTVVAMWAGNGSPSIHILQCLLLQQELASI